MTEKEKKARAAYVVAELEKIYPDAACALESGGDPWRLLVMGRLSAQCTDARVNTVCRELFAHFPDAAAMAAAVSKGSPPSARHRPRADSSRAKL